MYVILPVILFLACLGALILHFRKKHIIRKICAMPACEKLRLLNHLLEPFGFQYDPGQDIFLSRIDAWQRDYGYCRLYDESAAHFNMVFDCEPVYFDYDGRTWLVEFWKGQYGINIGGEAGIYRADGIIPPGKRRETLFGSVPDEIMP